MASPFDFAWMLLKDSARVAPPNPQEGGDMMDHPDWHEDMSEDELFDLAERMDSRHRFEQPQHPPMPRPEDEGPTLGEMADMDPEEAEFERELAARRMKPKPNDPAQTTLADFGG